MSTWLFKVWMKQLKQLSLNISESWLSVTGNSYRWRGWRWWEGGGLQDFSTWGILREREFCATGDPGDVLMLSCLFWADTPLHHMQSILCTPPPLKQCGFNSHAEIHPETKQLADVYFSKLLPRSKACFSPKFEQTIIFLACVPAKRCLYLPLHLCDYMNKTGHKPGILNAKYVLQLEIWVHSLKTWIGVF